jgi:hypothetical protein
MSIAILAGTRPRRIGFIAASAGAIIAISMADLGPAWYPIALALAAFPTVWAGGARASPPSRYGGQEASDWQEPASRAASVHLRASRYGGQPSRTLA